MGSLDSIFSEENMLGYAKACVDLASDMPESHAGFDTLIIPSRGALPIFLGMYHALSKFSWSEQHRRFYEKLSVQKFIQPLLPENSRLHECFEDNEKKVLLLPFTADLKLNKSEQEEVEFTKKTRAYWARVALSFMKKPQDKIRDPYFRTFTDIILRDIERREEVAEAYERFPKVDKFGIIDTVISGRASNDILRAFDDIASSGQSFDGIYGESLLPASFLLIDEMGSKLVPKFSVYLNKKKAIGGAKLYYVPRIVSEDEGANLEGVAAVIYPTVMESSRRFVKEGKEFFVGAGSWYIAPEIPYLNNFHKFMGLVYSAIDARFALDFSESSEKEIGKFKRTREDFLEYASYADLLDKHDGDPVDLGWSSRYIPARTYETGSHVLHIPFLDNSTQQITRNILALTQFTSSPISLKPLEASKP